MTRGGSTRRWRTLRAEVLRDEPWCQLRLTGCTEVSETADHIVPVVVAPELEYERSNLQGACASCNGKKGQMSLEAAVMTFGLAADEPEDDVAEALGYFD